MQVSSSVFGCFGPYENLRFIANDVDEYDILWYT